MSGRFYRPPKNHISQLWSVHRTSCPLYYRTRKEQRTYPCSIFASSLSHKAENSRSRALAMYNLRRWRSREKSWVHFAGLNKLFTSVNANWKLFIGQTKMMRWTSFPRPRLFEFELRALFAKRIHEIRARARVSCILNRFARTKPPRRCVSFSVNENYNIAELSINVSRFLKHIPDINYAYS